MFESLSLITTCYENDKKKGHFMEKAAVLEIYFVNSKILNKGGMVKFDLS
jgi:hypothetical protein